MLLYFNVVLSFQHYLSVFNIVLIFQQCFLNITVTFQQCFHLLLLVTFQSCIFHLLNVLSSFIFQHCCHLSILLLSFNIVLIFQHYRLAFNIVLIFQQCYLFQHCFSLSILVSPFNITATFSIVLIFQQCFLNIYSRLSTVLSCFNIASIAVIFQHCCHLSTMPSSFNNAVSYYRYTDDGRHEFKRHRT